MTEEQYKRAVEIGKELTALNETKDNYYILYLETKDNIKKTEKHRLWYAYNDGEFGSEWRLTPEWAMRNISDILDRHDMMIRQKIEDEINNLKKEIETL